MDPPRKLSLSAFLAELEANKNSYTLEDAFESYEGIRGQILSDLRVQEIQRRVAYKITNRKPDWIDMLFYKKKVDPNSSIRVSELISADAKTINEELYDSFYNGNSREKDDASLVELDELSSASKMEEVSDVECRDRTRQQGSANKPFVSRYLDIEADESGEENGYSEDNEVGDERDASFITYSEEKNDDTAAERYLEMVRKKDKAFLSRLKNKYVKKKFSVANDKTEASSENCEESREDDSFSNSENSSTSSYSIHGTKEKFAFASEQAHINFENELDFQFDFNVIRKKLAENEEQKNAGFTKKEEM